MVKFILGMLVLSSALFAQNIIVYEKEKFYYKDKILYHKDGNKPVNGVVRDEKNIKKVRKYYESTYVDGKKNGLEKYFYKRVLSSKRFYKDGYMDGMDSTIRNGKIKIIELYSKGKRLERTVYYDYDKKIVKESITKENKAEHKVIYTKLGEVLYDCVTKYPRLVKKCVARYKTGEILAEITPNGKKFSGFIYKKDGTKKRATNKDYTAMYNGYIIDLRYINKRFEEK